MELILKISVQSNNSSIRKQSNQIFLQYLIEYPIEKQRLENHIKQIILNVKYEHEHGRLSALDLVLAIVRKLPLLFLEKYTHLLFLPLTLQLVNDDSKQCRISTAQCISLLFKRISTNTLQIFYEYIIRWSKDEKRHLKRTAIQLFGIVVNNRVDFIKRSNLSKDLVRYLKQTLTDDIVTGGIISLNRGKEWDLSFFCLLCIEKLNIQIPNILEAEIELWSVLVTYLAHPHQWVKHTASRLIFSHLSDLNVTTFPNDSTGKVSFLTQIHGSIFKIANNFCDQLGVDEKYQVEAISALAIKSLCWILNAMHLFPHLCISEDELIESVDNDSAHKILMNKKKPVFWLLTRLSNLAKSKGTKRREAIFRCFAAFAVSCDPLIITPYLELIIEPLNRAIVEESNEIESNIETKGNNYSRTTSSEEVLRVIEEECRSHDFLMALAMVKSKAREKKEKRKQRIAALAVHDPRIAAKRKILKHKNERKRKKEKSKRDCMIVLISTIGVNTVISQNSRY